MIERSEQIGGYETVLKKKINEAFGKKIQLVPYLLTRYNCTMHRDYSTTTGPVVYTNDRRSIYEMTVMSILKENNQNTEYFSISPFVFKKHFKVQFLFIVYCVNICQPKKRKKKKNRNNDPPPYRECTAHTQRV